MSASPSVSPSHFVFWWSVEARADMLASATALALGVAAVTVTILML